MPPPPPSFTPSQADLYTALLAALTDPSVASALGGGGGRTTTSPASNLTSGTAGGGGFDTFAQILEGQSVLSESML